MKPSKKWQVNSADIQRVAKNALIFFAPAVVIFLTQLQAGATVDQASAAIEVWVLGVVLDFFRKLSAGK